HVPRNVMAGRDAMLMAQYGVCARESTTGAVRHLGEVERGQMLLDAFEARRWCDIKHWHGFRPPRRQCARDSAADLTDHLVGGGGAQSEHQLVRDHGELVRCLALELANLEDIHLAEQL